jgi:hypothetical protein
MGGVLVGAALAVSACTTSEDLAPDDAAAAGSTGAAGESAAGSTGAAGKSSSTGAGATSGSAGGTGASTGGTGFAGASGAGATGGAGSKGAAGAPATTGAGGADAGAADAGEAALTYANSMNIILPFYCGGCHFGVTAMGGFTVSYENVTGAVSSAHAGCPNLDASKRRVVPGKPDSSLLYIKISVANPPGACGGHMPYMGTTLSAQNLQEIHDWIAQGAKP